MRSNNFSVMKEGRLCYVVKRPYQGKGKPKLIMHEVALSDYASFSYGHLRHWVVDPPKAKVKRRERS